MDPGWSMGNFRAVLECFYYHDSGYILESLMALVVFKAQKDMALSEPMFVDLC